MLDESIVGKAPNTAPNEKDAPTAPNEDISFFAAKKIHEGYLEFLKAENLALNRMLLEIKRVSKPRFGCRKKFDLMVSDIEQHIEILCKVIDINSTE